MNKKNNFLTPMSAFIITTIILLIVYITGEIYPFGDHTLFKWDMELGSLTVK